MLAGDAYIFRFFALFLDFCGSFQDAQQSILSNIGRAQRAGARDFS